MRAAVIEGGVAVNIIEIEQLGDLPELELVEAGGASIGDLWDGERFTPPPAPAAEPDLSEIDTTWSE